MIDQYYFFYILFGFASLYLALGVWSARSVRTIQNYFLADRSLGVFQLTFALIASQLGSGMILGTAYRAHQIGLWGVLYTIGMSLGFIILGLGLASRMRGLNISTTAEIFETHYGSKNLKLIASLLSVISLWGILVAQIVASQTLFTGLHITDPYIFIACWLFVIAYAMLGGLQAIVLVDIAQVCFIITIFVLAFMLAFSPSYIKYLTAAKLAMIQRRIFHTSTDYSSFLPVLFIPTLFSLIEQDLAQKFFAAKTKATATIASLSAAIFLIVFSLIPLFLGMIARIKGMNIPTGGNPLVTTLAHYCPSWLFILAICAIMAAITATANSLLCAISSNIVQDFQEKINFKNHKLFITKLISLSVGISALIASGFIHGDIISILEESYRISVLCLFVPTIIAYICKPTHSAPAWAAFIGGLIGYIGLHALTITSFSKDIISLTLSFAGYMVAYLFISLKK